MNVFDELPVTLPDKLIAGNDWFWTEESLSDTYPPAEYILKYEYSNLNDGVTGEIVGVDSSGLHKFTTAKAVTVDYSSGEYSFSTVVTRISDQLSVTLNSKIIKIVPSTPEQSYNQKVLLAIRATIEKTATKEQMQYSISGMQLIRRSPEQLLKLEQEFSRRVRNERERWARENGQSVNSGVTKVVLGA
jgi:hypothetical protein